MIPETNNDPAIVAAREARAAFEQKVADTRSNPDLHDVDQARTIAREYDGLVAKLGELDRDLTERRAKYFEETEARVHVGAGIPSDASPADRALLMQTFRTALDRVRTMSDDEIRAELVTAAKYGDEQTQRAIEAVAIDENRGSLWNVLRTTNPDRMAALDEWIRARDLAEGRGIDGLFTAQALATPPKPREISDLPQLEAVEAKRRAAVQAR